MSRTTVKVLLNFLYSQKRFFDGIPGGLGGVHRRFWKEKRRTKVEEAMKKASPLFLAEMFFIKILFDSE